MRVLLAAVISAGMTLCVGCGDIPQVSREDDEFLYSLGREENGGEVENGGEIGMENGGFDGDFDSAAALSFLILMAALAVPLADIMAKVWASERTKLLFMGKKRRQPDRHSRPCGNTCGNPESRQKPSAFARRNVPTKALRLPLAVLLAVKYGRRRLFPASLLSTPW